MSQYVIAFVSTYVSACVIGCVSSEQDVENSKLIKKATKVPIIILTVSVSMDSPIFILIWLYPANWIILPVFALFNISVLVKIYQFCFPSTSP